MPKWNIDKSLIKLEKSLAIEASAGTSVTRVLMDNALLKAEGLARDEEAQPDGKSTMVWCVAIGQAMMPKRFFHGYTIYEAYQRARKFVKAHMKEARKAPKPKPRKPKPTNGKHVPAEA